MAQTVIGIFEKGIDAQAAVQRLESNSISSNHIDISNTAVDRNVGDTDRHKSDKTGSFFKSLFGNNDDARKHSEVAKRGWVVTVHANSKEEAERAASILDESGAVDVDERAELYNRTSDSITETPPSTHGRDTGVRDTSIPVVDEHMHVGKRVEENERVRLRSRIVERPVEQTVRLRDEHVHIERHPVDRPATERDFESFKEGEIVITEHREVPVVNKEARVVEEVNIGKTVDEHDEIVRSTVRKGDVDVDRLDRDRDLNRDSDHLRDRDRRRPDY